jgi:SAM-dependent methyltransferase
VAALRLGRAARAGHRHVTRRSRGAEAKRYDRAYFDKWYRDPRHQVKSAAELARQAAFVVAATEYIIERPVRSVLDVGCGEGNWLGALRRLRPRVRYQGVDASDHAVRTYGRSRNIIAGTAESLDALDLDADYDLVLCVGVLNYLRPAQLRRALANIRARTGAVAHLEIFTRDDDVVGDFGDWTARPAAFYRRALGAAGFIGVGMQMYVVPEWGGRIAALERARL